MYMDVPTQEMPFEIKLIVKPVMAEEDMNARDKGAMMSQKVKDDAKKKADKKKKKKGKK